VARFDLRREAEIFAGELSTLLDNTVCHGIRVESVIDSRTGHAVIGYGIGRQSLTPDGIPLTLGKKPPSGYLAGVSGIS
jgi:hypothetical protein